jgi:CRP-like cAMP-binding protein
MANYPGLMSNIQAQGSACLSSSEFLNVTTVERLLSLGEHMFVEPGSALINMNEECSFGETPLYVIVSGNAVVEGQYGVVLGSVGAGDFVGEGGAFGFASHRTATVRASGPDLLHCMSICGPALEAELGGNMDMREVYEEIYEYRQNCNVVFAEDRFKWLRDTVVPILEGTPLLAGCPSDLLLAIAAPLMEEKYKRGEMITKMGEPSDYMVVVLNGQADVLTRSGDRVWTLERGAAFGEICSLGLMSTNTANIRAACRCGVLKVSSKALQRAFSRQQDNTARDCFERICERRRNQGKNAIPLALLPSVNVPVDDLCARVISMQAELISLEAGEYWDPLPGDDLSGVHLGIFVKGDATLELTQSGHPITLLKEGSLLPEDLLHKRGARVHARSKCAGYRIRMYDFHLATKCVPGRREWLTRFHMLQMETNADLTRRLNAADGVTVGLAPHACDPEIHKWRTRKDDTIVRSRRMRSERLDLPGMSDPHSASTADFSSFETGSSMSGYATARSDASMRSGVRSSASAPSLLKPIKYREKKFRLPRLPTNEGRTVSQRPL